MSDSFEEDSASKLDSSAHGLLGADGAAADLQDEFDLENVLQEMDNPIHNNIEVSASTLRYDTPVAITKPPTTARDATYSWAFWLHFILIILLSLSEGSAMEESLIVYGKAGSWASFFMIVTILGAFCGCSMIYILANPHRRDQILSYSIPLSIVVQVLFGSILFALRTRYSFLGILVFLSVFIDTFKYQRARESVGFASAVINIVIKVLNQYGTSMLATCICLVLVQTLVILWWGSFFVGLISSVHQAYADVLVVIMLVSLYWIQQIFQSLLSYIIGGCTIWYFLKHDHPDFKPQQRVLMHLQCGLTVAFGSICKGALYSNFAMYVLELNDWSKRINEGNGSCGYCGLLSYIINGARQIVGKVVAPWLKKARSYHRLAFCVAATYGRTFSRAAADHSAEHEETLDIAIEDTTTHVISALSKLIPCILAIGFGMFVEKEENQDSGRSWSLFFLICYLLSYCGLSLALTMYRASVDALIVAFGVSPDKLAAENQIVFARYLRMMERG
jgi:hypothetical protein